MGGGFVKGLYRREAETSDRSSSKRSKWDPGSKMGLGGVNFSNFICTLNIYYN